MTDLANLRHLVENDRPIVDPKATMLALIDLVEATEAHLLLADEAAEVADAWRSEGVVEDLSPREAGCINAWVASRLARGTNVET